MADKKIRLRFRYTILAITQNTIYFLGLVLTFGAIYLSLIFPVNIYLDDISSQVEEIIQQGGIYYRSETAARIFTFIELTVGKSGDFGGFSFIIAVLFFGYLYAVLDILLVLIRLIILPTPGGGFGVFLRQKEYPELYRNLNEVAEELGVKGFDRIYIVAGAEAAIWETSTVPLVPIRRRNLIIGWLLFTTLTITQLKAVIAHELAHFDNNAFNLHRSLYRIQQRIINSLLMSQYLAMKVEEPLKNIKKQASENIAQVLTKNAVDISRVASFWIVKIALFGYDLWIRPYYRRLNRLSKEIRYEFEYYCDKVSAKNYGANNVIDALKTIALLQVVFDSLIRNYPRQVKAMGNCYPLFYQYIESEHSKYKGQEGKLLPSTDTHPSLEHRTKNLVEMPDVWDESRPLISQINKYQTLEVELTQRVLGLYQY